MTIEKLRRLWYLSTVPTHSPDSIKELEALVNRVIGGYVMSENYRACGCDICKHQVCHERRCEHYKEYPEHGITCQEWVAECEYYPSLCQECEDGSNFEMRMEDA